MRKIAFRAWDAEEKNFIYFDALNGILSECDETYRQRCVGKFEQFTGLLDKNGKEVYEGDILQNNTRGHALVVYRYGGFFVELDDCEEFGTMDVPLNEVILFAELIGNIHENPELLNG